MKCTPQGVLGLALPLRILWILSTALLVHFQHAYMYLKYLLQLVLITKSTGTCTPTLNFWILSTALLVHFQHAYMYNCTCTLHPLRVLERSRLRVSVLALTFEYFEYCQQPPLFKLTLQQYFTSVWHWPAWCEKGIPLARSYVAVSNILYFFMGGLNTDN